MSGQNFPIARVVRLLSKTVRLSRDGLNAKERAEIAGDLLELVAALLEDRDAAPSEPSRFAGRS